MTQVLDVPEVRDQVFRISVETYQRLIDEGVFDDCKVELISGLLFKKMSKSKLHIHIVKVLFRILLKLLDSEKWEVQKEDPLRLVDSEPEPDLAIIRADHSGGIPEKPKSAEMVIEVAVTSLALDQLKGENYAAAGIPEYWIVRPGDGLIEVYRNPVEGAYQESLVIKGDEALRSSRFPEFEFRLSDHL